MFRGIGFLLHIAEGLISHLRAADLPKREPGAAGCPMRGSVSHFGAAERGRCGGLVLHGAVTFCRGFERTLATASRPRPGEYEVVGLSWMTGVSYSPAASPATLTTSHSSTHRASTLRAANCSSAACSVMSSDGCAWGLRMP